jgi:hypothetical protein
MSRHHRACIHVLPIMRRKTLTTRELPFPSLPLILSFDPRPEVSPRPFFQFQWMPDPDRERVRFSLMLDKRRHCCRQSRYPYVGANGCEREGPIDLPPIRPIGFRDSSVKSQSHGAVAALT